MTGWLASTALASACRWHRLAGSPLASFFCGLATTPSLLIIFPSIQGQRCHRPCWWIVLFRRTRASDSILAVGQGVGSLLGPVAGGLADRNYFCNGSMAACGGELFLLVGGWESSRRPLLFSDSGSVALQQFFKTIQQILGVAALLHPEVDHSNGLIGQRNVGREHNDGSCAIEPL
jgi:hypothetical protein